ncbi:MAG: hypothetical protein K2K45_07645 [Muribaculaceae bacterium]|nr:hypothetical protein [Muribaculaceae bacterium]
MNPIIDPNTLTEEQREKIRKIENLTNELEIHGTEIEDRYIGREIYSVLESLFGENFFKKGE